MVRRSFAFLLVSLVAAACGTARDDETRRGGAGNNGSGAAPAAAGALASAGAEGPAGGRNLAAGGAAGVAGNAPAAAGATSTAGGNTGGTGSTGSPLCGPPIPSSKGRCASGTVVAKGSALTIHDFEEPGEKNDYLSIFFGDGRAGTWADLHDTTAMAAVTLGVEASAGGAPGNTRALRYRGAAPGGWGATLATTIASCYDARAYPGVSFYIKGDAAAGNSQVKFSLHSPLSEPAPSGGCSMESLAAGKCYDHFASVVSLSAQWQRVNLKWSDLKPNCASDPAYEPQAEILTLSFSILDPAAGFDFWVDNLSFDPGNLPTNTLAELLPRPMFEEMWLTTVNLQSVSARNSFYTYEGFLEAAKKYPAFATTGTAEERRRELAAFFSNVAHETDSLALVEETACVSDTACTQYGVAPNGKTYHGRGPIQLTHGYNYQSADSALNLGIVQEPDLVSSNATIAWSTALWFWMTTQSGKGICHDAYRQGLGATINIINGIECGGANPGAIANRIRHYKRFCQMLGIDPGPNQGC